MVPESKSVVLFEGLTMTSAGTVYGPVDTLGYDFMKVHLAAGTGEAASTAVTTLRFNESDTDTLMTAYTDGDAITAFVGAAAVSTSAGFVLPALSSTKQNSYTFNMDLRGRKRYIGINFAPEKQTVGVSATAELHRTQDGPAQATAATTADGARVIVSG
jgi:hypothetical protein